jgi:lipoprotein-anchoring transpeptidase ErfK/SrfK
MTLSGRKPVLQVLRWVHGALFAAMAAFLAIAFFNSVNRSDGDAWRSFVSIDRGSLRLGLFERGHLVRSYRIAVGAAGHETPSGSRRIVSKEKRPAWFAPNRPWAGDLAGQVIPYGDPRNPLKIAFLGLGEGLGIHGTTEQWSIGSRASHGCIRMRDADIKSLYGQVSVGTPVLIL